ncbi:MAG: hypothetical protein H6835_13610 [Planctomycetes bacterium]|nr:hypothetical protein [Planctomycetota bacterium]
MLLSTDPSPWLAVFGRFHIVLLHLPIGLLPGMFVLEFGAALLKKSSPRGAVGTLAAMTALCAGAAFASGLVLADEKVQTELLGDHKKAAIAMTALCVLLPILAFRRSRRPFRLALFAALALSVVTGHLGGSITHKKDFLFKPLEANDARPAVEPPPTTPEPGKKPFEVDTIDLQTPVPTPAEAGVAPADYARDVVPILKRVCIDCHNPDKEKGDLLMTDTAWLERTGDDVVVVPGDPAQSYMIQLLELPLDDDDHMPPKDEAQPTGAELAMLRRWIDEGAKH